MASFHHRARFASHILGIQFNTKKITDEVNIFGESTYFLVIITRKVFGVFKF